MKYDDFSTKIFLLTPKMFDLFKWKEGELGLRQSFYKIEDGNYMWIGESNCEYKSLVGVSCSLFHGNQVGFNSDYIARIKKLIPPVEQKYLIILNGKVDEFNIIKTLATRGCDIGFKKWGDSCNNQHINQHINQLLNNDAHPLIINKGIWYHKTFIGLQKFIGNGIDNDLAMFHKYLTLSESEHDLLTLCIEHCYLNHLHDDFMFHKMMKVEFLDLKKIEHDDLRILVHKIDMIFGHLQLPQIPSDYIFKQSNNLS